MCKSLDSFTALADHERPEPVPPARCCRRRGDCLQQSVLLGREPNESNLLFTLQTNFGTLRCCSCFFGSARPAIPCDFKLFHLGLHFPHFANGKSTQCKTLA